MRGYRKVQQEKVVELLLSRRIVLQAYIFSIVRDPHLSEDVFQEVAVEASCSASKIVDEQHFEGWIRRTARYKSLNALRRVQSDRHVFSSDTLDILDSGWEKRFQETDQVDRLGALRQCLEQLSPKYRRLIDLRYVGGCSGASIAGHLGRPVESVYVSISRVHKILAACISRRIRRGDNV